MKLRSAIAAMFTGSIIFSPVANAFWFFQHRAAPVRHVSIHHRPARHHHWHRGHLYRRARTYRRIITEYRIYYVPAPWPHSIRGRPSPSSSHKPHNRLPLSSSRVSGSRLPIPPLPAAAPAATGPVPQGGNKGSSQAVQATQNGQQASSRLAQQGGTGSQGAPTATAGAVPLVMTGVSAAAGQHNQQAPMRQGKSSAASPPAPLHAVSLPTIRSAAAAGRTEPNKEHSLPLAPFAAAILMAGLGYVLLRKHRRMQASGASGKTAVVAGITPGAERAASGTPKPPQVPPRRNSFNYDEIRRIDVDQVFMAPLSTPDVQAQMAAANHPGNVANATVGSSPGRPHPGQPAVVQHIRGETVTGVITELYNTPELKAGLQGFYQNIPTQFHDAVWVKVAFGQHHAFAITQPELNAQPGDTVQLMFGQQEPPIPNQVVAILDAAAAAHG